MTGLSPRRPLLAATLATLLPLYSAVQAQEVRVWSSPDGPRVLAATARDRLVLGISSAEATERADTLGLRLQSVERDSPADKAGLKAGDRLQAINGVSLRADRGDAGERDYDGVLARRLQREMGKVKEGDEVELRVYSDGRTRTVKVKPQKSSELYGSRGAVAWTAATDRAMLGVTIGSTGSPRDTLGVFVSAVTSGGPAEKAGLIEGDRIAAINGVSVRVASADAEDAAVGTAKAARLRSEIAKLKAGDVAELTVVSAGRTRTLRVTAVKASDMPGGAMSIDLRGVVPALEGMARRLEDERVFMSRMAPTPAKPAAPPTPPTPPAASRVPAPRGSVWITSL